MKLPKFLLFISSLLCTLSLWGQHPYIFRQIDANSGLSDNLIKSISGNPDGRISILTTSVFNLYNGGSFEYFRQNNGRIYTWKHSGDENQYVDEQNRIWIKQDNTLQILNLSTNLYEPDIPSVLRSYGIQKKLADLFIDGSKNYWFLTEDHTLSYYDTAEKKLITVGRENVELNGLPRVIEQKGNIVWIVYSKGLIRQWSLTNKKLIAEDKTLLNRINPDSHVLKLRLSVTGGMWLMHHTDIFYLPESAKEWKTVSSISGLSNFFTAMDVDKTGNVWVGTSKAEIRVIQKSDFSVNSFTGLPLTSGGTIVNDISSIFVDGDNGVWAGTLFQGIGYYHPSMIKVSLQHTLPHESHITNENVRGFLEEPDGRILVATGNGLFRYDPGTNRMETAYPELKGKYCMSLYKDSQGRIWIPTFHNGFYCIRNGRVIRNYTYGTSIHSDPNPNSARGFFEDAGGQLWVSVQGGVGKFDPDNGKITYLFEKYPEIRGLKMNLNFFPADARTFAVAGEDLFFYNTETGQLSYLPYRDKFDRHGAEYNFIYTDKRGLQWLSVDGLKVWDPVSKKLHQITINESRPNQTVSAILEDSKGNLWVSTMNGISKVEPEPGGTFKVLNFGRTDGAGTQAGRFNTNAALKASDGTFYFGGVHGVNIFHPDHIHYNPAKHKPLFTGLRIFNTPVQENTPFNDHIILKESINEAEEIRLKYNENFITLEFAGLNYANPSKTFFRYRLEDYDQNWVEIQADGLGRANYTGLPPGNYTFKVYAANNDKVWGDEYASLNIVITPPVWATVWAKLLYTALFLAALVYLVQWVNERNRKKLEQKRAEEEQKQKERLEQMKLNFFTNISHEFRTPLSLIMTPLDLLSKEVSDEKLKQELTSIYGHSRELLALVNQLLDFRKLEMAGEELKLSYGDITEFLEIIYNSFKPVAKSRGITFLLEKPVTALYMHFDKDKMLKIMNNLLSNAFKFTPEGGRVSLAVYDHSLTRDQLEIRVSDSGIGIREPDQLRVFERFHQASVQEDNPSGSGIGLYLVKEYTELHEGTVTLKSEFGAGTEFILHFPTDLQKEEPAAAEAVPVPAGGPKKILIVEDNAELRQFLNTQLSKHFTVFEARDGEEGEKIAVETEPDLILSDAMMPKTDGITLCKTLKSRVETSHIPFILLTAKTSEETQKSVYEAGADAYMSKPFIYDLLLTRIEKLIEQQEKRKALFHTTIEVTPNSITINSLDEALVQKALQSVEDHMDNPDYNVDDLGKDMGLSRGNLYRKLQSITGKNPSDFIRSIRLKRAAQLLRDSDMNVAEIADMTGFNSMKYFNRHFKDTFRLTPTQYRSEKR